MQEFIRGFLRRHRLFHDPDLYADTVVHFARFCTPPGTSDDGLAAACMYMTWVLYLDDSGGGSIGGIGSDVLGGYLELVRDFGASRRTPGDDALHELVARVSSLASAAPKTSGAFKPDRSSPPIDPATTRRLVTIFRSPRFNASARAPASRLSADSRSTPSRR